MNTNQLTLLNSYKHHLSSRRLFSSVYVDPAAICPSMSGNMMTLAGHVQITVSRGNCGVVLHECIHAINWLNETLLTECILEATLDPHDYWTMAKCLFYISPVYTSIARPLVSPVRRVKDVLNGVDELLAQVSSGYEKIDKDTYGVLSRVVGCETVRFLIVDSKQPEYYPKWTGETYV